MNKQELIEEIKNLANYNASKRTWVNRGFVLELVEQLDEPQKVTIPHYIADWIEYCKNTFLSLVRALMVYETDFYNYANQEDHSKLIGFLESGINQEIFARAWLDGYTVEKEKKYRVSLKNGQPLLKACSGNALYFSQDIAIERYEVTRKQLEEAGFGEVFNSPLFEVEEVEE